MITPHVSAIRDADKVVGLLTEGRSMGVGLVVNKMRGDLAASGDVLGANEIASLLKVRVAGVIPEDDRITVGLSLALGGGGRAFKLLADNVRSGRGRLYDCESRYTGFLGSIRRKLKRIL